MAYVESYVLPVETSRLDDYRKIAIESADIWLRLGALSVMEATGVDTPMGSVTSFPRAVQLTPDETVVVAYLTFRDRAHRDEVMKKMEADPQMIALFETAPVDGKRMIWGGFTAFVDVKATA
jgi:uncharacterized protein YbaA (DUF1428 family)